MKSLTFAGVTENPRLDAVYAFLSVLVIRYPEVREGNQCVEASGKGASQSEGN